MKDVLQHPLKKVKSGTAACNCQSNIHGREAAFYELTGEHRRKVTHLIRLCFLQQVTEEDVVQWLDKSPAVLSLSPTKSCPSSSSVLPQGQHRSYKQPCGYPGCPFPACLHLSPFWDGRTAGDSCSVFSPCREAAPLFPSPVGPGQSALLCPCSKG